MTEQVNKKEQLNKTEQLYYCNDNKFEASVCLVKCETDAVQVEATTQSTSTLSIVKSPRRKFRISQAITQQIYKMETALDVLSRAATMVQNNAGGE
ncbi:hypothetical protein ACLKA7_016217 [Drosophila subpalustris]